MTVAMLLTVLADFDQLPLAFGVPDRGLYGHRGLTHTPLFALSVGLSVLVYAKLRIWERPFRAALMTFLLVASHALLDAMSQDGRGILLLWPLSAQRFHLIWRPIPDAPTGLAFFSAVGLRHLIIELIYFSPAVAYGLAARPRALGAWRTAVSDGGRRMWRRRRYRRAVPESAARDVALGALTRSGPAEAPRGCPGEPHGLGHGHSG
jgi:inner membrane protein